MIKQCHNKTEASLWSKSFVVCVTMHQSAVLDSDSDLMSSAILKLGGH